MKSTESSPKSNKKVWFIIASVVFLCVLAGIGGSGVYFHLSEIKALEKRNKEILTDFENRQKLDEVYKDSITKLIANEKILTKKAARDRAARIKAEQALRDIRNLIFNRGYLDSIADHYWYDGPGVLQRGQDY